jgi:hypothetical protein
MTVQPAPIETISLVALQAQLRAMLPALRERYGVATIWLFGSRLRGEAQPDSDLDVLVEFDDRPLSLLKFVELENHLSDVLGLRVDLVEKLALKPRIGQYILAEAQRV